MLFNSFAYFIFFAAVVALFLYLPQRFRWMFLLAASYFYYLYWDPRYIILILGTTVIVYGTALLMHDKPQRTKKLLVAASIVINLSILVVFKYFNFINTSIHDLLLQFKVDYAVSEFDILKEISLSLNFINIGIKNLFSQFGISYAAPDTVPEVLLKGIGISFYTFQAIGYTIDVYRGTRKPERHFGIFALYVSFFPVLLSGPIERSTTLLPQFYREIEFDYDRMTDGLKLMAWGFFQKFVIADRLGQYVNVVYGNPQSFDGVPLLLGTYLFVIQVYCDFAGYTDMAIGSAQVLGFKLMPNFKRPYYAPSLGELWRRWHISLISWFRDYLYIPLGGNRVPTWRRYINMIIIFTLSGLWHGAQWTFVAWGSMNGVMLIISRITQRPRDWIRETFFGGMARIPAAAYFVASSLGIAYAIAGSAVGVPQTLGLRILAGSVGLVLLVFGAIRIREAAYTFLIDNLKKLWMILATFHLFVLGAIFFRSKSIADAWYILTHLPGVNFKAVRLHFDLFQFSLMFLLIVVLNVVHIIQERRGSIRALLRTQPAWLRWLLYVCLCVSILMLGVRGSQQFIYFQF